MKKDILVIGESCRDIYIYCESIRLCPDIPVPVLKVMTQNENVGMAKNVQRNILAITNQCDILTNSNWAQITKTRYVHEKTNHTFIRVDTPEIVKQIDLKKLNYDYKIIVISDYNKGFLTESDIEEICSNHDCVFIDTKKVLGDWINNAKYIKINDIEYQKSKSYINDIIKNKIIHTLGGDGCEFKDIKYSVDEVEVKDASGAGDSFLAALVVKYLQTQNIEVSIQFANKCAAQVVKQKGVSVIH